MDKKKVMLLSFGGITVVILILLILIFFLGGKGEDVSKEIDSKDSLESFESYEDFDVDLELLEVNGLKAEDLTESALKSEEEYKIKEEIAKVEKDIKENKDESVFEVRTDEKTGIVVKGKKGAPVIEFSNTPEINFAEANKNVNKNQTVTLEDLNKDVSFSKVVKGDNKVTGKFKSKLPDNLNTYVIPEDKETVFVMDDNYEDWFIYDVVDMSKNYMKKGESTYHTESFTLFYEKYTEEKNLILTLMKSTGFNLTEEEFESNIEKVEKMNAFDGFDYKGYRFIRYNDDVIQVKKLY